MAFKHPLIWSPLGENVNIPGFGILSVANESYFGPCLRITSDYDSLDWKKYPIWVKSVTGVGGQYKYLGDFLKRKQDNPGDMCFFPIGDFNCIVNVGKRKEEGQQFAEKMFLYIKSDGSITEVEDAEIEAFFAAK